MRFARFVFYLGAYNVSTEKYGDIFAESGCAIRQSRKEKIFGEKVGQDSRGDSSLTGWNGRMGDVQDRIDAQQNFD